MTRRKSLLGIIGAIFALALLTVAALPAFASDPDDNGSGPDRGTGTVDSYDANNGCGNDLEKADDSEGWCGNKHDGGGGDPTYDPTIPDGVCDPAWVSIDPDCLT